MQQALMPSSDSLQFITLLANKTAPNLRSPGFAPTSASSGLRDYARTTRRLGLLPAMLPLVCKTVACIKGLGSIAARNTSLAAPQLLYPGRKLALKFLGLLPQRHPAT